MDENEWNWLVAHMDPQEIFLNGCEEGNVETVQKILENGVDVDLATASGNTGLVNKLVNLLFYYVLDLLACNDLHVH